MVRTAAAAYVLSRPQIDLAITGLKELVAGGHLMESRNLQGGWYVWRTSSGKAIPKDSVEALVNVGVIERAPGLFDDVDGQNYVLTGRPPKPLDQFLTEMFGPRHVVARFDTVTARKARADGRPVIAPDKSKRLRAFYDSVSALL